MAKRRRYCRPVGVDPIDRFGGPNIGCNVPDLMVMESYELDKLPTCLSALWTGFCATGWNTAVSGQKQDMKQTAVAQ